MPKANTILHDDKKVGRAEKFNRYVFSVNKTGRSVYQDVGPNSRIL